MLRPENRGQQRGRVDCFSGDRPRVRSLGAANLTDAVNSSDLSIVMATHNASAVIARSLGALFEQTGIEGVEVIIADSSTDGTGSIAQRFPGLRLLHFDEALTVPELRGRGIAAAGGSVIAILDPFAIVAELDREVIAAHNVTDLIIGGGRTSRRRQPDFDGPST
jgi:hypothetical protein